MSVYLKLILCSFIFIVNAYSEIQYDYNEEIVVTGTRTPKVVSDAPVKTEVLTGEQIEEYHYKSIDEVLPHLPGVNVMNSQWRAGQSAVIQGLGEDHVLVLIDGIPQLQNSSGGFDLSQISAAGIEKIEVVKGASSALYGSQAMGGVINIITKNPEKKLKYDIDIETGAFQDNEYSKLASNLSLSLAKKIEKLGYRFYLSTRDNPSVERDLNTITKDSSDSQKYDGGAMLSFNGENGRNYALNYHFFSEDIKSVNGQPSPVLGTEKRIGITKLFSQNISLSGEKKYSDTNRLSSFIFWEESKDDLILEDNPNTPYTENQKSSVQRSYRAEVKWDGLYFKRHLLSMGLVWTKAILDQENISGLSENDSISSKEVDKKSYDSYQAFFQDDILFERWELVPGFRVQTDPGFGANFSPKISARYNTKINDIKTVLRTSIGTGYRVPNLKERFYFLDHRSLANYIIIGNEDLKPERSLSYQLGSEFIFNKKSSLYLNAFFNKVNNLINTELVSSPSTLLTYQYININSVDVYGIEFNYRNKPLSWFSNDLSYTFSKATNNSNNNFVPFRPVHIGRGALTFSKPKTKLSLSTILTYQSSQYLDIENTRKSSGYLSLDLRANYDTSKNTTLYIGVENLMDSKRPPADDDIDFNNDLRPSTGRFFYVGFKLKN